MVEEGPRCRLGILVAHVFSPLKTGDRCFTGTAVAVSVNLVGSSHGDWLEKPGVFGSAGVAFFG